MEASSLYIRCNLSPAAYQAVMSAPVANPRQFDDWQRWYDSKDAYGAGELSAHDLDRSTTCSLGDLIAGWVEFSPGSRSHYDEQAGVWTFAVLEFTDNYGEMLQLLAPLRQVAHYADVDSDSFLLIYSYIWGNGIDACLSLGQGRSEFIDGPSEAQRAEADAALEQLWDSVAAAYEQGGL
ncbi:hypothetical protein [Pseudomonas donghuensis]|uniref:hypothetical protein n=1 Tax=Pseudomonas donghuensis TaxID=1163398 RepID=UPI002E14AFC6|nr:hypothetical protein VP780_03380 [Pseudomonas donghuensis]